MKNQVFIHLKNQYEQYGQIATPEELTRYSGFPPSYIVEGIFAFNQYLDQMRAVNSIDQPSI